MTARLPHARRRRVPRFLPVGLVILAGVTAACEPASITEARGQLRRGGERITTLAIPLGSDSFAVASFLPEEDTTTTPDGAVGLRFSTDSVTVSIGDLLEFDNLAFDPFSFSFDQMLQTTAQSIAVAVPAPPILPAPGVIQPLAGTPTTFATPAGSTVDSAVVGTGRVIRSITNQTGCDVTGFTSSLLDGNDNTVLAFPARNVPSGPAAVMDTILIDTIPGGVGFFSSLKVDVPAPSFGACVPAPGAQVAASVDLSPMTLTRVRLSNVNEGFTQNYGALASDARIQAVDTVEVYTGSFTLTLTNRLPITDTLVVRLNGITRFGQPLVDTLAVPAAAGDGSTTSGQLVFDLAGARIVPADVDVQVIGTAKAASATITPTNAANAVTVSGGGSLVVQSLAGALDPLATPELTVTTESSEEFERGLIDLGDMEDAIRSSSLNYAALTFDITNGTAIPMSLGLQIGVVQLDATGQLVRLPGGAPQFETDGSGVPILFSIADPGSSQLTIGRGASRSVSINAPPLIERLMDLVLDGTRTALVVAGGASLGDGQPARISRGDFLRVRAGVTVGLDITIPPGGVTFTRTQVVDGADLDADDADQLATRLLQATAGATVTNGTPFGLTVSLALTADSLSGSTDVFALPVCGGLPAAGCRVSLDSVVVPPSVVNAQGQVVTASTDSITVSLSGTDARVLLGRKVSLGIRVRLLPGTGGGGRGAIRPEDRVMVSGRAEVDVRYGGGGTP